MYLSFIIFGEKDTGYPSQDGEDYVSITNLARHKSDDPTAVIGNWMRNRNTIEFLGIWESLYNPDFKPLEFEGFRREAGLNAIHQMSILDNDNNLRKLLK